MKWDEVLGLIQGSANRITLESNGVLSPDTLREMGIPEASTLGQVMLNVKRFTVNGYLRVFGADIPQITDMVTQIYPGDKIVVAADVWGGIFAIGNGDFNGDTSIMWYYAPDTLQWESMDISYRQFVTWVFSQKFAEFHSSFLWRNIEEMLQALGDNQAILVYPFLWSKECNIETATKKAVPFNELLLVNADYQRKLYSK